MEIITTPAIDPPMIKPKSSVLNFPGKEDSVIVETVVAAGKSVKWTAVSLY